METCELNLNENNGKYEILWFNPRKGGQLEAGSKKIIEENGKQNVGEPPYDNLLDWVVIVKKSS